jgi:hypothetical protein
MHRLTDAVPEHRHAAQAKAAKTVKETHGHVCKTSTNKGTGCCGSLTMVTGKGCGAEPRVVAVPAEPWTAE